MQPVYHGSAVAVRVGDHVQLKVWIEFWRGWMPGRVQYVPGQSPKNDELEFNGLSWVAIDYGRGKQFGVLVDPDTHQLRRNVRFIRRSDDGLVQTPADYTFGD